MVRHIGPLPGVAQGRSPGSEADHADGSFGDILAREVGKPEATSAQAEGATEAHRAGDVRFSAHARERLESRHIEITQQHQERLDEAVSRAGAKGANQSLVLLDDLALVVSVRNRVVITALDDSKARSGVFTNIDSAVIA